VHTKINRPLSSYKWGMAVALAAMLCNSIVPPAQSAIQESGLVTAGSFEWSFETTWAYATVDGKYPNIFREQGRMYAVILLADQKNGKYVDDQIGIYNIDPGRPISRGWRFPIQEGESRNNLFGVPITARLKKREGSLWLVVELPNASKYYEIALKNLYMSRARKAERQTWCGREYLQGAQSGAYIYFEPSVSRYFNQAAPDNFRLLAPIYVGVWEDSSKNMLSKFQIGDTGCWMYNRGGWYSPDPPK
jgi:hypothetical protein